MSQTHGDNYHPFVNKTLRWSDGVSHLEPSILFCTEWENFIFMVHHSKEGAENRKHSSHAHFPVQLDKKALELFGHTYVNL